MPSHNRNPKIITPKGERYPGSGRKTGTPNKASVDARILVGELVGNPDYQRRLRRDFALRKLHPTIESMVWAYHVGRPRQDVNVTGTIDVNATIEEERRAFLSLELPDLEQLAAESQALVDRAMALAKVRTDGLQRTLPPVEPDLQKVSEESLTNEAGSDNVRSVNESTEVDSKPANPYPDKA